MKGLACFECLPDELIDMISRATSIQACAALARCSHRLARICIPILYCRDVEQQRSTAVSKTMMLLYSYEYFPEDIFANAMEFDLAQHKDHLWAACSFTPDLGLSYREHVEILIRMLGGGALEMIPECKVAKACGVMRRLRRIYPRGCPDFGALIRNNSPRCSEKSWLRLANAVIRLLFNNKERQRILSNVISRAQMARANLRAAHNENKRWLNHHYLPQYGIAGCHSAIWPPPVTMAMGYRLLNIVKRLCETEPLISYSDDHRFPYATVVVPSVLGDVAMLQFLQGKQVSFKISRSTILHFAASREQLKAVEFLVKCVGIDVNEEDHNGYTPFMCYLMGVDEMMRTILTPWLVKISPHSRNSEQIYIGVTVL